MSDCKKECIFNTNNECWFACKEKIKAEEREKTIDEIKARISSRLIDNLNLANATKYGNKNAKQQANSYSTVMKYEIADCVDDLLDDLEQLKGRTMADERIKEEGLTNAYLLGKYEGEKEGYNKAVNEVDKYLRELSDIKSGCGEWIETHDEHIRAKALDEIIKVLAEDEDTILTDKQYYTLKLWKEQNE